MSTPSINPDPGRLVHDLDGLQGRLHSHAPLEHMGVVELDFGAHGVVRTVADTLRTQPDGSLLLPIGIGALVNTRAAEETVAASSPAGDSGNGSMGATRALDNRHSVTVPVVEERLSVSKQKKETGVVSVSVTTQQVPTDVEALLANEQVEVERVQIDREVDEAQPPRVEQDVTIVPVYEERLVVQKQLILREEIRLTRKRDQVPFKQTINVCREQAEVSRKAAGASSIANSSGVGTRVVNPGDL